VVEEADQRVAEGAAAAGEVAAAVAKVVEAVEAVEAAEAGHVVGHEADEAVVDDETLFSVLIIKIVIKDI